MIKQCYLTENPCYQTGRKINVQGLMLHSVGCSQPNASVFVRNWNKDVGACVHAFIDGLTGDVYQCLPWNHRGWHCGGQANNTHIGVEMCEPDCITYNYGANFTCSDLVRAKHIVKTAYDSAVELFAGLCVLYALNPLSDIISHNEGYRLGVASGHADPEHLWQGLGLEYTMDGFRKAVDARIKAGYVIILDSEKNPSESKFEPYRVVITCNALNVRSGAGMNYPVVTQVHKNEVYTIVNACDGWGKLKSGAGWIYLVGYTQKI